jgi:antitoxin component of MazEF toxin-antitoxin module
MRSERPCLRCARHGSADLTADTLRVHRLTMTKKLMRHGNSAALVIDKALMDLLNMHMDTSLEVTTDGKNIIISPQGVPDASGRLLDSLEKINKRHGSVLKKLGQ